MIKHIVCFKLNEGESVQKAKEVLLSMKGNVPVIIDIEVGTDLLHSARSYDVILQVTLKDMQTLEEFYQITLPLKKVQLLKTALQSITKFNLIVL